MAQNPAVVGYKVMFQNCVYSWADTHSNRGKCNGELHSLLHSPEGYKEDTLPLEDHNSQANLQYVQVWALDFWRKWCQMRVPAHWPLLQQRENQS